MSALAKQHAVFRFYAELNDFLPAERRFGAISHAFELPASVKDMIESLGVPHPEVSLILRNGAPVDFAHRVQAGDRISVYPVFRSLDVSTVPPLRPPLPGYRFVLDMHLGRLATYLRLLGFDAAYKTDCEDRELARISCAEGRILLSRDCGLLKRGELIHGYFVRATEPRTQTLEVMRRFNLFAAARPFRRCLRCNAELHSVAKAAILERLPPGTRDRYHEFRICPTCNRVYWAGSHYEHMQAFVQHLLAQGQGSNPS